MSHPVVSHADKAVNTLIATGIGVAGWGAVDSNAIISVGALLGTIGVAAGKILVDLRTKSREQDTADAKARLDADMDELARRRKAEQDSNESWGGRLREAVLKASEWEGKFNNLSSKNADLQAQNTQQAVQIKLMEEKMARLTVSQNDVIKTVNKQQTRVKDAVEQIKDLQHVVGSSSNLNLPTAGDGTDVDMPNMG